MSFDMAEDSLRSPTKISLAMTSRQELSGKQSKPKSRSACGKKDKLDFGMSIAAKSNVSIENIEQIISKLWLGKKDISCLDDGEYFNDIIINFYINYLQLRLEEDADFQEKVTLMNTYWINDLFHKKDVNLFMKMIEKNK